MQEEHARTIVTWRYDPPYAYYSADLSRTDENIQRLLIPHNPYFGIHDDRMGLIGFCCFGAEGQVPGGDYTEEMLDIGLGLRPDLTGSGNGYRFFSAILDFTVRRFGANAYRLTVAGFNARAIRLYEKAGFKQVHCFTSLLDGTGFVQMVLRREEMQLAG